MYRAKCARSTQRSSQADKVTRPRRHYQEQDLTPSSSPPGRSVISTSVICHWSFPVERHQSWSLTLCAACHPSARSLWDARASAHDNATTRCHCRAEQEYSGGDGGPLCFHTRFRSHVSHYHGIIYIPGAGYAADAGQVTGRAGSVLFKSLYHDASLFGLQKSVVISYQYIFDLRNVKDSNINATSDFCEIVREKSDFREHLNRRKTIFRRNRIDARILALRFQRPLVVP
ncbi:hypothetical protein QTP88_025958 [Uroleucon formosanum]